VRAAGLLVVFVVAKALMLAGRPLPGSVWAPLAYLWQDVLVVLVFAAVDRLSRHPRLMWALYGAAVAYTALNVAVVRVLSSPLTWPMLRAARGTLADSIRHHLTLGNAAPAVAVLAVGVVAPLLLRRLRLPSGPAPLLVGLAIVAVGPSASARVDTSGLHRNAIAALMPSSAPAAPIVSAHVDWAASPSDGPVGEDLTQLRGAAAGRHVVLVVLESAGAGYLRPYGADLDPMPHLTRLAERSILFEHAYAVYPESVKGLIPLLFSRYPAYDTPAESDGGAAFRSLPSILGDAGYVTALFHSGRFMYLGMREVLENRGFHTLEDAGAIGGRHESSFGVDEESAVRRILSWIDGVPSGRPFFVAYLPVAGHHPYATPVPGPFPPGDEVNSYRNALHYGDTALALLMDGLRSRGLDRRTLIVVVGDHAEAFGQHAGNYGHTLFLYEENVRVPYLIAAPGLIEDAVRVKRLASLIDTAPTILDLVGLTPPAAFQGASLLDPGRRMALFFTDYSLALLGLRDGCWKQILDLGSDRSKLFDVCTDPAESRDLARERPVQAAAYEERLRGWIAAQSDR
jgi:hypothetical protein